MSVWTSINDNKYNANVQLTKIVVTWENDRIYIPIETWLLNVKLI